MLMTNKLKLFVMGVLSLFVVSCLNISTTKTEFGTNDFKKMGESIGMYVEVKYPDTAEELTPWIESILKLTDQELAEADVLSTLYKKLIKRYPDDAALIILVKSVTDIFGVDIRIDTEFFHNESSKLAAIKKYAGFVKAVLKGYLETVKEG